MERTPEVSMSPLRRYAPFAMVVAAQIVLVLVAPSRAGTTSNGPLGGQFAANNPGAAATTGALPPGATAPGATAPGAVASGGPGASVPGGAASGAQVSSGAAAK